VKDECKKNKKILATEACTNTDRYAIYYYVHLLPAGQASSL